jgi:hypothetical protein
MKTLADLQPHELIELLAHASAVDVYAAAAGNESAVDDLGTKIEDELKRRGLFDVVVTAIKQLNVACR